MTETLIQTGAPHPNLPPNTSRWMWGALFGLLAHLGILWWGLKHNYRRDEQRLLPTLGYGNGITIARGILISLLAGFLFIPAPTAALAWLPAGLYTTASILDYLDGYVARITNHATILGELLDMEFDGLGLLIAIGVAIRYGQLPAWYLILGFGRQLFLLGLWIWHQRGLPTFDMTESENRRIIAGFQMGFISVMLWPILTSELTTIVCILFSIPLAASFGRDWFVAIGRVDPQSAFYIKWRHLGKSVLERWGPTCCRLAGSIIGGYLLWEEWPTFAGWSSFVDQIEPYLFQQLWQLLLWCSPLIIVAFLLGVLSRISALLLLALAFSDLVVNGASLLPSIFSSNVLLLICLVWVLQFGGGNYALWAPAEAALHRRAGSRS